MKQKGFVAQRKQRKRRRRVKEKVRAFEKGEIKFEELPRLGKDFVARKRRAAAHTAPAK